MEIITSCYSIPTLEDCQGRIWKGSGRICLYRSPRPKQFVAIAFVGSPRPPNNLNVHTGICSAFAVPTSPGICVLKFKMKFLHVRTLGTMITGYRCQLYMHFVLISCHYCLVVIKMNFRCYEKWSHGTIMAALRQGHGSLILCWAWKGLQLTVTIPFWH